MVNELKGSLYYSFVNLRYSLLIFWLVLAGVFIVSLLLDTIFEGGQVSFNMSVPTYFFAAIFGYWMVKNAIPYMIKMGSTRPVLFLTLGIFGIVLSLFNAVLSNTINEVVTKIYGNSGLNDSIYLEVNGSEEHVNHIGDFLTNNTWLTRVVIDSSISFFLFACLFISGLIFYKYGLVGGFASIAAVVIVIIFAGTKGWLQDFVIAVFTDITFTFFYQLFAVGIVIYLLSYLLLRRLTLQ